MNNINISNKELIELAMEAREASYSPYSNFKVGAALLTASGNIYTGCNIESAAFTPTICAERTALSKAVSAGDKIFLKIAVVGNEEEYTYPCGVCRQFLREFTENMSVIVAKNTDDYIETTLEKLLPHGFGPSDLNR